MQKIPYFWHFVKEECVTGWVRVHMCCSHPGTASGHGLGWVMPDACRLQPKGERHSVLLEGIDGEVISPSPLWGNFQTVCFCPTTNQNKV